MSALPQRRRRSTLLAALLVTAAVLFPTLGGIERLLANDTEERSSVLPASALTEEGLAIEGAIVSVNPVAGTLELRLAFRPTGSLGEATIPTREITVFLSDSAGRNVLRFEAGRPMDLAHSTLTLPRAPLVRYPFDRYRTELLLAAVQHTESGKVPLTLSIQLYEEVAGYDFIAAFDEARATELEPEAGRFTGLAVHPAVVRIDLRRSSEVIGYALGLALLMLGLAVGNLLLLWSFVVARRPLEPWFATYGVGVVFSLPRLRDSMPAAPPVGIVYDYLVYYWALAVTAVALLLIVGTWFARARRG